MPPLPPQPSSDLTRGLLNRLPPAQLQTLVLNLDISGETPAPEAPPRTRINAIIDLMSKQPDGLARVCASAEDILGPAAPLPSSPLDPIHPLHGWLQEQAYRWRKMGAGTLLGQLNLAIEQRTIWVELQANLDQRRAEFPAPGSEVELALEERPVGHIFDERSFSAEKAFRRAFAPPFNRRGVVFIGDPGSGKSMLLRRLFLRCVDEGSEALGLEDGLFPVLISLRELSLEAIGEARDLRGLVKAFIKSSPRPPSPGALGALDAAPLLLLLDGWDEVLDGSLHARLTELVKASEADRGLNLGVSTRPHPWRTGSLGSHLADLRIRPLNESSARQLVSSWARLLNLSNGVMEPSALDEATLRDSEGLWLAIQSLLNSRHRRVRLIAINPLLLGILCLSWHTDKGTALPERRHELYERALTAILIDWPRIKDLPSIDVEETLRCLQAVALALLEKERFNASHGEWRQLVGPCLPSDAMSVDAFLEDLKTRGLLIRWGEEDLAFYHRTFQEYLAARALVASGEFERLALQLHEVQHREDGAEWAPAEGWEEVILLALALDDKRPPGFRRFIQALIDQGVLGRNPPLLRACFEDARQPEVKALLWAMEPRGSWLANLWRWLRERMGRIDGRPLRLGIPPRMPWEERSLILQLLKENCPAEGDIRDQLRKLAHRVWVSDLPWVRALDPSQRSEVEDWARGVVAVEARLYIPGAEAGEVRLYSLLGAKGKVASELELVWVPPGSFDMGSDEFPDERPIHRVSFKEGFWLGRFPVTNGQYGIFLEANPTHPKPPEWENGRFNAPTQPVVGVSWEDAQAFCEWAGLALPSEAMWEYGARGPEGRTYPWGEESPTQKLANFGENVGATTPVGGYREGRSWVEAQDMVGNVWEWVADSFHEAYDNAPDHGGVWSESGDGLQRVLRGGSWVGNAGWLRGSYRSWNYIGDRYRDGGFRVASPRAQSGL